MNRLPATEPGKKAGGYLLERQVDRKLGYLDDEAAEHGMERKSGESETLCRDRADRLPLHCSLLRRAYVAV